MEDIDQHRISRILGSTMTPIERPRFGNFGLLGTMGESLRVRLASAEAGKGFRMTREKPDLDGPDLEDIRIRLGELEEFATEATGQQIEDWGRETARAAARDIRTLLEEIETERNTAAAMLEAINALHGARTELLMTLADMLKLVDEWIPLISRESVVTEEEARLIERAQTVLARAAVAREKGKIDV